MTTTYAIIESPVGPLLLTATDAGLTRVWFERRTHGGDVDPAWTPDDGARGAASEVLAATRAQLGEYFAGARTAFDLPLAAGGTPFQRAVWDALRAIPYGATTSYAALAARIGQPAAVRAVGAANGRNPIPIIVPCHRVIGARGELTGFGGGIERKRWLLELEGGGGLGLG